MTQQESLHVAEDGAMTDDAEMFVAHGIRTLATSVSNTAHAHGWWDGETEGFGGKPKRNMGEMIALMHSELSEALEAWRDGDDITRVSYTSPDGALIDQYYVDRGMLTENAKPVGVASEFADVIIRVLDTCHTLGIPIVEALLTKSRYNISRPYRHGGKLA